MIIILSQSAHDGKVMRDQQHGHLYSSCKPMSVVNDLSLQRPSSAEMVRPQKYFRWSPPASAITTRWRWPR
jgi:hypothetical protein